MWTRDANIVRSPPVSSDSVILQQLKESFEGTKTYMSKL
jgi:hypothetical protein